MLHKLVAGLLVCSVLTACAAKGPLAEKRRGAQPPQLSSVRLVFHHFGQAVDPGRARIAESGKPDASLLSGSDVWLQLQNRSDRTIAFLTFSMYLLPLSEWVKTADGRSLYPPLRDGIEIAVIVGVEDARGKRLPYGSDTATVSRLPAGVSVLFSVPRAFLSDGRSVFVEYDIEPEIGRQTPTGPFRVYFRSSDLPRGGS